MDRIVDYRDGTEFRGSDIVQTRRLVSMGRREVRTMELTGSGDRGRYELNYSYESLCHTSQKLKV